MTKPLGIAMPTSSELLGLSANAVVEMKKRGADHRTALACRALLHRMEPYA